MALSKGIIALKLALYDVTGGAHTFIKNVKWNIAVLDDDTYYATRGGTTPVYVDDFAPYLTKFYCSDDQGYLPYDNLRRYLGSNSFDIAPYDGKTIRAEFIDDPIGRYFKLGFTVSTHSTTMLIAYIEFNAGDNAHYYDFGKNLSMSITSEGGPVYIANCTTLVFCTTGVAKEVKYTYTAWDNPPGYVDEPYTNIRNVSDASPYDKNRWNGFLNGYTPEYIDTDNPYDDLVNSETKGGSNTNFSEDSDTVTTDILPTISSVGTGFATLFTPSKSQLRDLSEIFWNSNFFTAMQNLIENITGMFTSLSMVPFTVPSGATVEVTWLGMAITEVRLTLAAQQFIEFDMGSINLGGDDRIFCYDNCLDYSPFSSLGIYLPFIGYQELDIDECRKHTISLKYRVDILSGACVALISIEGNVIYQFTGNCLTQIPITNESIQSLISDAVNVGIAATQTHAAKGAVGAAESALSEAESSYKANPKKGSGAVKSAEAHLERTEDHLLQTKSSLASASANASMGLKPQFSKTGSVSAAASMLSVKQPYLFLTTPRMSMPQYYEHYAGFPSNITGVLNTFSGFTVVESIRLNNLVATAPEVSEIYDLLHSGVII